MNLNRRWIFTHLLPIFLVVIVVAGITVAAVPSFKQKFTGFISKFGPKADVLEEQLPEGVEMLYTSSCQAPIPTLYKSDPCFTYYDIENKRWDICHGWIAGQLFINDKKFDVVAVGDEVEIRAESTWDPKYNRESFISAAGGEIGEITKPGTYKFPILSPTYPGYDKTWGHIVGYWHAFGGTHVSNVALYAIFDPPVKISARKDKDDRTLEQQSGSQLEFLTSPGGSARIWLNLSYPPKEDVFSIYTHLIVSLNNDEAALRGGLMKKYGIPGVLDNLFDQQEDNLDKRTHYVLGVNENNQSWMDIKANPGTVHINTWLNYACQPLYQFNVQISHLIIDIKTEPEKIKWFDEEGSKVTINLKKKDSPEHEEILSDRDILISMPATNQEKYEVSSDRVTWGTIKEIFNSEGQGDMGEFKTQTDSSGEYYFYIRNKSNTNPIIPIRVVDNETQISNTVNLEIVPESDNGELELKTCIVKPPKEENSQQSNSEQSQVVTQNNKQTKIGKVLGAFTSKSKQLAAAFGGFQIPWTSPSPTPTGTTAPTGLFAGYDCVNDEEVKELSPDNYKEVKAALVYTNTSGDTQNNVTIQADFPKVNIDGKVVKFASDNQSELKPSQQTDKQAVWIVPEISKDDSKIILFDLEVVKSADSDKDGANILKIDSGYKIGNEKLKQGESWEKPIKVKTELPKPTIRPISIKHSGENTEVDYNTTANAENELYPGDQIKTKISFTPKQDINSLDLMIPIPDNTFPEDGTYGDGVYNKDNKDAKTLTWTIKDIKKDVLMEKEFYLGLANSIPIETKTINLKAYTKQSSSDEKKSSDEVKLDIWGLIQGKFANKPEKPIANAYVTLVKRSDSEEEIKYDDIEHNYITEDGETRNFLLTKKDGSFELKYNRNTDLDENNKYRLALYARDHKSKDKATINFNEKGVIDVMNQAINEAGSKDKEILRPFVDKLTNTQHAIFSPQVINDHKITNYESSLNDLYDSNKIEYPHPFNNMSFSFQLWPASQKAIKVGRGNFNIPFNHRLDIDLINDPLVGVMGFFGMYAAESYFPKNSFEYEFYQEYNRILIPTFRFKIGINEKPRIQEIILWHEMGHYFMNEVGLPNHESILNRMTNNISYEPNKWYNSFIKNHAGYLNYSTIDSVVEGWAEFFAAVVDDIVYGDGSVDPISKYNYNSFNPAFVGARFWSNFSPTQISDVFDVKDIQCEDRVVASLLWRLYRGINSSFSNNDFPWLGGWPWQKDKNKDYSLLEDTKTFNLEEIADSVLDESGEVNSLKVLYDRLKTDPKNQGTENEIGLSFIDQLYLIYGMFYDSNKNTYFDLDSKDEIGLGGNTDSFTHGLNLLKIWGSRPWREFPPIYPEWSIKTDFVENEEVIDSSDRQVKLSFVFPEEYSFNNYEAEVPVLNDGKILFNLPMYFSPYKVVATTEGSSDYFYITSEDYFEVISSDLSFNYLAEKIFNIDGSTPPTVEEIIAKEAEKNTLKPLPYIPIPPSPTPSATESTVTTSTATATPTKDVSAIPAVPTSTSTSTKDISIPAPVLSLTNQDESGKEIPRDNNKLKAGESVSVKVEGLTDAKKVEVYLDNKKIAESPILSEDFSFKVTPDKNTMIGTHTIKLLADNGKSAEVKIKITENNWFNKNTGKILLIIALIAAMFCFIIPILKNNLHNFRFGMK